MKPFLTMLWLTGSAVYLTGTLLFLNAVNFNERDEAKPAGTVSLPVKEPQAQDAKPDVPAEPQQQAPALAAVERPHAISPDQPTTEPPAPLDAAVPLDAEPPLEAAASLDAAAPPEELPSTAEQATPEIPAEPADTQVADLPRLKTAANIRSGPSRSATVVGTAAAGAELHVTGSSAGWVQFMDPSSRRSGWVHSSLLEGSAGDEATIPERRVARVPEAAPPKSKSAKAVKQKSKDAVASKRQERGGSAERYAELPSDEEFLPPRRRLGLGLLERRRLLRQGLMSPGFMPPQ